MRPCSRTLLLRVAAWVARALVVLSLLGYGTASAEVLREPVAYALVQGAAPPANRAARLAWRRAARPAAALAVGDRCRLARQRGAGSVGIREASGSARARPLYLVLCALLR